MKLQGHHHNRFATALFLAAILFTTVQASAAPVTIFSSTFDNDTGGATTTLNDWTVTAGNVDVLGNPDRFLDMDGFPLSPTFISSATLESTPLTLSPGTYQLSFELGNNSGVISPELTPNGVNVSLGSLFSQLFPAPIGVNTLPLSPRTAQIIVTATTTASLIFQEVGTSNAGGSFLNNVLLELITPPAPANFPATLDIAEAEVKIKKPGKDKFEVEGSLTLDANSDGVDILTEDVTVTLDGFSETIPAGSFFQKHNKFKFHSGSASGIKEIEIRNDGRFEVEAKHLDLSAIDFSAPVPFSLSIGNDVGEVDLLLDHKGKLAELDDDEDDDDDHHDDHGDDHDDDHDDD